jgi:hypothetical protein
MLEVSTDYSKDYFVLGCDAVHSRKLITANHRNLLLLFCALKLESLVILLLRVTWEANLLGGSLLGNSFVNMKQYCRRC